MPAFSGRPSADRRGVERMKYRDVEVLLRRHGFQQVRQSGSHRTCAAIIDGVRRIVTLSPHSWNDDVHPGVLGSNIRQSGLPKALFR